MTQEHVTQIVSLLHEMRGSVARTEALVQMIVERQDRHEKRIDRIEQGGAPIKATHFMALIGVLISAIGIISTIIYSKGI